MPFSDQLYVVLESVVRVKFEYVSMTHDVMSAQTTWVTATKLTIEHGVRNETARIDSEGTSVVHESSKRFAIAVLQVMNADKLALELIRVQALDISPMILVEVRKLVVQQDRRIKAKWNVELDEALLLLTDGGTRVVDEGVLWGVEGIVGMTCSQAVVEVVGGHVDELQGSI